MFEFDFLSLLCITNTLRNILMMLGINVEQDKMSVAYMNGNSGGIGGKFVFSKKPFLVSLSIGTPQLLTILVLKSEKSLCYYMLICLK